ncbi:MAG: RNA polymerase sigma factor RpoD/SigA [Spirochaetaceae bacterium]|jgi:RNA polymerase primary sigma factor|nr:RNA polymerase sigma factor RpoD/SigA [Spirochaetaceae bacterium]
MKRTRNYEESRMGSADENIISMYLRDISKVPLLTREEEDIVARQAVTGNQAAVNKLVAANLRFVVNIAKRYQGQGLPLSDLIGEGNIGLINAVEKFDVDKGYHFISYAVWWIRQSILKAICEKSRMIRLPMNRAGELVRIEKIRKEIPYYDNAEAEIREIAQALNMDERTVADLIAISREMISLDAPMHEGGSANLGEYIEDETGVLPDDFAVRQTMIADIESVLSTLSEKEAAIIRYRYGIGDAAKMTLTEIGYRFNLTKERIRQIEKKALKRLKHPRRLMILESYVA